MRRRFIFVLIAALVLVTLTQASDDTLPPCTREEFVAIFELVAASQVDATLDLSNFIDLLRFSQTQLNQRESVLAQLPTCADGIETHRALLDLGADIVARHALDLASLPADENPYRQQLASDHERIETLTESMLNRDRTNATRPEARRYPACADEEFSRMADLAAEFLVLFADADTATGVSAYVQAVAKRLAWREANLPRLPACAESIPLGLLLSRASSDAAANLSLAYAGVSRRTNPYDDLEAQALVELGIWLEQAQLRRANTDPASSGVRGRLPACTQSELATANNSLQPAYAQMDTGYGYADDMAARLAQSRDHVESRASLYRQLPGCAEAFQAGWWLAETFSDAALQVAFAGKNSQVAENYGLSGVAARAALVRLESVLDDEQSTSSAARRGAPVCRDAQTVYFNVYILPSFHRFTEAALGTSTPADLAKLVDAAQSLRDLLWAQLPRCNDSLAAGWLMRRIATDFIAMLALESAGAEPRDIPYVDAIIDDMEALAELMAELNADTLYAEGLIYYVIADGYVNLRSCGSTECEVVGLAQRGDILRVLDDVDSWYKIQLSDGDAAWIAGFLASQTPPDR